ncbi:MAG: hypothetical protein M5U09_17705 [Gammaproteobacteria bacterium]|nr:hypothetical protein [Gammaproteobacteria bacterium]
MTTVIVPWDPRAGSHAPPPSDPPELDPVSGYTAESATAARPKTDREGSTTRELVTDR